MFWGVLVCMAIAAAIVVAALYVAYRVRTGEPTGFDLLAKQRSKAFLFTDAAGAGVVLDAEAAASTAKGDAFTYCTWMYIDSVATDETLGVEYSDRFWLLSRGDTADDPCMVVRFTPGINELNVSLKTSAARKTYGEIASAGKRATDACIDVLLMSPAFARGAPPRPKTRSELLLVAGLATPAYAIRASQEAGAAYGAADAGWASLGVSFVPLQRWVHLAVVVDGASMRLYLDGDMYTKDNADTLARAEGAVGPDDRAVVVEANRGAVRLGCTQEGGTSGLRGRITRTRFYNEALTRREVAAEYARGPGGGSWLSAVGLPAYKLQTPIYVPQ